MSVYELELARARRWSRLAAGLVAVAVGVVVALSTVPAHASYKAGTWTITGGYTMTDTPVEPDGVKPRSTILQLVPGMLADATYSRTYLKDLAATSVDFPSDARVESYGDSVAYTATSTSRSMPGTSTGGYAWVAWIAPQMRSLPPSGYDGTLDNWRQFVHPVPFGPNKAALAGEPWGVAFNTPRVDPTNPSSHPLWGRGDNPNGVGASYMTGACTFQAQSWAIIAAVYDVEDRHWHYHAMAADGCLMDSVPMLGFRRDEVSTTMSDALPVFSHALEVPARWQQVKYPTATGPAVISDGMRKALTLSVHTESLVAETFDATTAQEVYEWLDTDASNLGELDTDLPPSIVDTDTAGGATVPGWMWNLVKAEIIAKVSPLGDKIANIAWPLKAFSDLSKDVSQ